MANDAGQGGNKPQKGSPPSGEHRRATLPPAPTGDLKKTSSTGDLKRSSLPPTPTGEHKKARPPGPLPTSMEQKKAKSRRLEMIDYPDDTPLVDHKGRSKPLYKPQTPRGEAPWRPSRLAKLALGLFPGLRLMTFVSLKEGLFHAVLGIAALVAGVMLATRWSGTVDRLQHLHLRRELILLLAAAIFATVIIYELVRLASALAEPVKGPTIPRILASFILPSALAIWAAPSLVLLWPRLIEPIFLAAVILGLGGLPGAIWCIFDGGHRDDDQQRRLRLVSGGSLALLVGVGLAFTIISGAELAELAEQQGFQVLPRLLR